jgi:hypothetical protein
MSVDSESSIQKIDSDDSIVACQQTASATSRHRGEDGGIRTAQCRSQGNDWDLKAQIAGGIYKGHQWRFVEGVQRLPDCTSLKDNTMAHVMAVPQVTTRSRTSIV